MGKRTNQRGPAPGPPDREDLEQEAQELLGRMLFVLNRRVRASNFTIPNIDEAMGVSSGYTSHLLQGDYHLQASHIASIAKALGVPQREIYAEVFPEVAREPGFASEADPPPAWWPQEEVMREVVGEIIDDLTEPLYMDGEMDEPKAKPRGRRGDPKR